jgi:hypothetical protein
MGRNGTFGGFWEITKIFINNANLPWQSREKSRSMWTRSSGIYGLPK